MSITREIRKSAYNDYFAIDYIEDGKIIETPLYLKPGEEQKIKLRWDFEVTNSNGTYSQYSMMKGFIKFEKNKIFICYDPSELHSGNNKDWFEPTEWELLNPSITHFKIK